MSASNYIDELADVIREKVPGETIPDDEQSLAELFRLYALLARVKGQATTREDVHDAWAVWKIGQGERHEALRPYAELDPATRQEDEPYVDAIRQAAREVR